MDSKQLSEEHQNYQKIEEAWDWWCHIGIEPREVFRKKKLGKDVALTINQIIDLYKLYGKLRHPTVQS